MFNRCILVGRMVRDPELRYLANGTPVAKFTVAVDRPFKGQAGEKEADFIDVVAWRKLAEPLGHYGFRGRLVAVEGRLQIRSYEDTQGTRRKAVEIVADLVRFLDRNPRLDADREEETPVEEPAMAGADAGTEDVPA
jgi:single-strand DNA-binding protein